MLRIVPSGESVRNTKAGIFVHCRPGMHQTWIGPLTSNNNKTNPKHPLRSEASAFPLFLVAAQRDVCRLNCPAEYRALARALEALPDSRAAKQHARSALLFRARRRSIYPGSDSLEATLEIQEGLPEYTGQRLAMRLTGEGPRRVAQYVRDYERNTPSADGKWRRLDTRVQSGLVPPAGSCTCGQFCRCAPVA